MGIWDRGLVNHLNSPDKGALYQNMEAKIKRHTPNPTQRINEL